MSLPSFPRHSFFSSRLALTRLPPALCAAALTLAQGLVAGPALAADGISVTPLRDLKLRVDGSVHEWPEAWTKLTHSLSGSAAATQIQLGEDGQNLLLGLKTEDAEIFRSKAPSAKDDHLSVELSFVSLSGQQLSTNLEFYPGDPGKLPAAVLRDGKPLAGATAIEAASAQGYELEAKIPWASLPELKGVRVGLRARVVYTDSKSTGQVKGQVASAAEAGQAAPPLFFEAETELFQQLISSRHISPRVVRQVFGHFTGPEDLQKAAIYDHYLTICGSGYRGGREFYFSELDVEGPGQITRLEIADFNGDGRDELILGKRIGQETVYREVIQVLSLGKDDAPLSVFLHEVANVSPKFQLENQVRVLRGGGTAKIEISQGKATGVSQGSFNQPSLGPGIGSALLPWDKAGTMVFAWKGEGLALVEERANQKAAPVIEEREVKPPPAPRAPNADELLDQVYELYRKDRGVAAEKPRFDFVTDVAGDEQTERILVHGRDVLVFGKGFKSGRSYSYITVGVKNPEDILSVSTRDLLGDGKAEILVHGVLRAKTGDEQQKKEVLRQVLYVYRVLDGKLVRIFAAETGRSVGDKMVLSGVSFLPGPRGTELELRPTRALGFTEKTYPFPADTAANGGVEPLLLPWGASASRRYVYDAAQSAFVPKN